MSLLGQNAGLTRDRPLLIYPNQQTLSDGPVGPFSAQCTQAEVGSIDHVVGAGNLHPTTSTRYPSRPVGPRRVSKQDRVDEDEQCADEPCRAATARDEARRHVRLPSVALSSPPTASPVLSATASELIIAITALRAGQHTLVKASIAGAIVTNALFMLGACLLIGGLRYHVQEFNRSGGRLYSGLLLMATVALLAPSAVADLDLAQGEAIMQKLSVGLAILLIAAYGLGLLFSLKTHKELFASAEHSEVEAHWPIGLAVGTLLVVTVLVALVSEIFVESVQKAAETFGMSPAFVGFIIVSLVGAAAEFAVAFSAARARIAST
jgi:hypothetical protein